MPQISKNEAGNMCVLGLHTVIVTTFITTDIYVNELD